jgi:hypothetical protein
MIAAYADPPYIGQSKKRYACKEVDHKLLIEHMIEEYDCWALSCSSPTLKQILNMCPDSVRVGAWVKPFASFKPNVNPAYCWEPIVFWGGRKRDRYEPTVRDFISANITLKKGLCGAKPRDFCFWIFNILGLTKTDELHDLFPGTGIVTECWEEFKKKAS